VQVYIGMTDMQLQWYRNILKKDIDVLQVHSVYMQS
jgi:hypothetical protein